MEREGTLVEKGEKLKARRGYSEGKRSLCGAAVRGEWEVRGE